MERTLNTLTLKWDVKHLFSESSWWWIAWETYRYLYALVAVSLIRASSVTPETDTSSCLASVRKCEWVCVWVSVWKSSFHTAGPVCPGRPNSPLSPLLPRSPGLPRSPWKQKTGGQSETENRKSSANDISRDWVVHSSRVQQLKISSGWSA